MRLLSAIATSIAVVVRTGLAAAQQVTIRMWMHEHPPRIAIDKAIIAAFEKANPDIKVRYDVISGRLTTASRCGAAMAASTVATIPIAALFIFFQRYFVRGLTAGAVKG